MRRLSPTIFNLNRVAEGAGCDRVEYQLAVQCCALRLHSRRDPFPIHILQEGKDPDQGVGYLEDGTMVVIAGGKSYMDRTVTVEVTRLINKQTGRMIFAKPATNSR